MPYDIQKKGNQYCVMSGGKTVKCHPTQQMAKDHMAALYANVKDAKSGLNDVPNMFDVSIERKTHG